MSNYNTRTHTVLTTLKYHTNISIINSTLIIIIMCNINNVQY